MFGLIKLPDCEEIMNALDECHARGFLYKALGNCNDIKRDVNKCLSAERSARAKRNRDVARDNRRRIEQIWGDERVHERGPAAGVGPGAQAGAGAGASEVKQ